MIDIKDQKQCCGCSACVQKCPKHCISIKEDNEGFLYPIVEKDYCIDCGLCEKVCPVLNQGEKRQPIKVFAAKNKNEEIRLQSSSGGFFTLLAEAIIKEGGVVFGARFDDNWEVRHDYAETIEGLDVFRGSKYLQSRVENSYQKTEVFLKQGRKVLFTGTPCQIAGLKCFLGKEYDNLLTIDFVCHGVPSPGVWRRYLDETIVHICENNSFSSDPFLKENVQIESISFRDKSTGWKTYSFSITASATTRSGRRNILSNSEVFSKNTFMKGFLANLYLRPSCYACPAKCGKSGSEITIGDLWGAPSIIGYEDDDRGTSLVIVNKNISYPKEDLCLWLKEIDYASAIAYNPCIEKSVNINHKRKQFYSSFQTTYSLTKIVNKLTRVSSYEKCIRLLKRVIKCVLRIINESRYNNSTA